MSSTAEELKLRSERLRGTLAQELADHTANSFSTAAGQLLKFHGVYQQDDRDERRRRTRAKEDLAYSCMVRCSVPGGVLTPGQWAEIDRLADDVGDGTLRLTTRQGVQYHFVTKRDLGDLIEALNRGLVTTYAACGDVVRNVMVSPAPVAGRELDRLASLARTLSNRFRPQSSAYWELWLDGERAVSSGPLAVTAERTSGRNGDEAEPIYGEAYLPRKFKIGIAWPGDNSVDVYSQDLGIVPVPGVDGTPGAVILAGGGLGRSHQDPTTFPRLADPLCWVPDAEVAEVAEAIVTTFRDHGDRADRSHARLKYVVEARGIDWLRAEVERRLGHPVADPVPLPPWGPTRQHLGWHRQQDGTWFLGLPVPSGRLADADGIGRRRAVRRIVADHASEVRLTPHQDLLLCGIAEEDRARVDAVLADHGVPTADRLSLSVLSSMACPALPTCGQALGEAERVLPTLTSLLDRLLTERGLGQIAIETRLTGCPNGCARPYVAELGIVGRTKTAYDVFVGGDRGGARLAQVVATAVPFDRLDEVLAPLLDRYRAGRLDGESFGDWAARIGPSRLAATLPSFERVRRSAGATA